MKVIDFSSFAIELLNFQICRTRTVNFQDKSTNTTPFPRFSGEIFNMEAFKVVLDDSPCHIWGTTTPNLFFHNSEIHMCIMFQPFFIYPNTLSIFKCLWSQSFIGKHLRRCLTCLVPIFAEYRSPMNLTRIPELQSGIASQCFIIIQ